MNTIPLRQKIIVIESRTQTVTVTGPEVKDLRIVSCPDDLRAYGLTKDPDGWKLTIQSGARRLNYRPLTVEADGVRVEIPTRIFGDKECFVCVTTTCNYHWGCPVDKIDQMEAEGVPWQEWEGDGLTHHGINYPASRQMAELAQQGMHVHPLVAGVDQFVGSFGSHWAAAARANGFRGFWGTCFDHATCDSSCHHEGLPWDGYRISRQYFRYPEPGTDSMWGYTWTVYDLCNSFLEYPSSGAFYNAEGSLIHSFPSNIGWTAPQPPHWKSVDGHNPSVLLYYGADARWAVVEGERVPKQYIDYKKFDGCTETGAAPKESLPQLAEWREELNQQNGRRVLRVSFHSDRDFVGLPVIWWDRPDILGQMHTKRTQVTVVDVRTGHNEIVVPCT